MCRNEMGAGGESMEERAMRLQMHETSFVRVLFALIKDAVTHPLRTRVRPRADAVT